MWAALGGRSAPANRCQSLHQPNTRRPIKVLAVEALSKWQLHLMWRDWLAPFLLPVLPTFATRVTLLKLDQLYLKWKALTNRTSTLQCRVYGISFLSHNDYSERPMEFGGQKCLEHGVTWQGLPETVRLNAKASKKCYKNTISIWKRCLINSRTSCFDK